MEIYYSFLFRKSFKKLSLRVRELAIAKEALFKVDRFDQSLKTHKLHGRMKGLFAFSINREYRIVFERDKDGRVFFLAIGKHDVYE